MWRRNAHGYEKSTPRTSCLSWKLISSTTTSCPPLLPSSTILRPTADIASAYILPDFNVFICLFIIHEPSQVAKIFAKGTAVEILWCSSWRVFSPLWLNCVELAEPHQTESQAVPVYLIFSGDSWGICHSLRGTRMQAPIIHSSAINFRVNLIHSMHSHAGLS